MPTLQLDDRSHPIAPGQTLLDALESAGVAWPSSCRVGACGTCRCRVRSGDVHERTESAYLLSRDEIDSGVVLACQTEARGPVTIERLAATAAMSAVVVAINAPTPSVRELVLRPDTPLAFRAGQVALLRLPGQDGSAPIARTYSFAAPPAADGTLRFLIRLHPGGAFSEALRSTLHAGDRLELEGPSGGFALPDGDGPLLVVGAGTGVAPLLALLETARTEGRDARDVRAIVVARHAGEQLGTERLAALASRWRGRFDVVPVFSRDANDAPASRSRPADRLPALLADFPMPQAGAAVCGPAGFVDVAAAVLLAQGLRRERLALDRFDVAAPVPAPEPEFRRGEVRAASSGSRDASWRHTLKFGLFHLIGLAAAASMFAGGAWTAWGLVAIVATYVLGDALLGDDLSVPEYRHPAALTGLLWSALPLIVVVVLAAVWRVSPGDALGIGAGLQAWTGIDVLAARDASGLGSLLATWGLAGLMIGMVATVPAHELVHRTWDPRSMALGRALLAFSFDTSFAIEHVHGHHRAVATPEDPASAPRGRSVYAHILHSTWHGNASAWRIESARLAKRGSGPWTARNAVLRGWGLSALLVLGAAAMGGPVGALFFIACGLWGKALLEIVNYMEHYGIARDPATPVQPRHSWNTNRRVSSWSMFNLTRHSHHHAQGEAPFHALRPMADAPMMPAGYLSTILLTLVPPLWRRLMAPRLADWDARFATPVERALARAQAEG